MLTCHLHLALGLRVSGAIPLLPSIPSWHEQGQLYHYYHAALSAIFSNYLPIIGTGEQLGGKQSGRSSHKTVDFELKMTTDEKLVNLRCFVISQCTLAYVWNTY
jgi:hypothetical protein